MNEEDIEFIINNYKIYGGNYVADKLNIKPSVLHSRIRLDKLMVRMKQLPSDHKACSTCCQIKSFEKFYKSKKGRNGLHASCIECFNLKDLNRYKTDESFRLLKVLRKRFKSVFNEKEFSKNVEIITGCTIMQLKNHLESQFKNGMTWDNYGKDGIWEIDHIIPISLLSIPKNRSKMHLIFHYQNYQPLLKTENIIKSNNLGIAKAHLSNKINVYGNNAMYIEMMEFLILLD